MTDRKVLVVTGMHRSGTSLVASILQNAGLDIGKDLMGAFQGNPRGHFEDMDFYRFQENILVRSHHSFLLQDTSGLNNFTEEDIRQAEALISSRSALPIWGWKDPRTSLFLEFWLEKIPDAKFVLLYRHPLDVCYSLMRRAAVFPENDAATGLRAWCVYNREIFRFVDQHPNQCFLANINGLCGDFPGFIRAINDKFHVTINPSVDTSIFHPEELKSHRRLGSVIQSFRRVYPEPFTLFDQLEARSIFPEPGIPENSIDSTDEISVQNLVQECRNNLQSEDALVNFLTVLAIPELADVGMRAANSGLLDKGALTGQVLERDQQLRDQDQQLRDQDQQLRDRDQLLRDRDAALGSLNGALQAANSRLEELEILLQGANSRLADCDATIQLLASRLETEEQSARKLAALVEERVQTVQSLASRVADGDRTVQALMLQLQKRSNELTEIKKSKAWKFGLLLRKIRLTLAPEGSLHFRILRFIYRRVLFPSKGESKPSGNLVLIRSSGLFDRTWYLNNYPDVSRTKIDPARHYLRFGGAEGRSPHPLFDSAFYLSSNPDVAASGMNPLVHYLQFGWLEGRDPHPQFDTSYYLAANPDIATSGMNPLVHYVRFGGAEGRNPNPDFNASQYLAINPGIQKTAVNPLVHFMQHPKGGDKNAAVPDADNHNLWLDDETLNLISDFMR